MDKSIRIALRRKRQDEQVARLRKSAALDEAEALREQARCWADEHLDALRNASPDLPDALDDRALDIAEPLFAIADEVGGKWPARAREAIVALRAGRDSQDDVRVELLADIWVAFERSGSEFLGATALIRYLTEDESSRWREWRRGQPITPTGLAKQLKHFEIEPTREQHAGDRARGYPKAGFKDAWERYVPSTHLDAAEQASPSPVDRFPRRPDRRREPHDEAEARKDAVADATGPPVGRPEEQAPAEDER